MSVSSIFSNVPSASDPLSALYAPTSASSSASIFSTTGISPTADTDGTSSASSTSPLTSAATSTSVSSGAQLLKELQGLQQSSPAEFQKVTADIAAQLQAAGQQEGGSQGRALTSLAGKFQQASQAGSLSPLQAGQHGGHHHGGHHHGGGGLAVDLTASTTSAVPPAASAASAAIAAYQQYTDPSSPLTGAADLHSQVTGIIGQVLSQDLGGVTA